MRSEKTTTIKATILTILLTLAVSVAEVESQEPESQTIGVRSQAQQGELQNERPTPPWSKWMTHRGQRLIAFDDASVQAELFGPSSDLELDASLAQSRREAQRVMSEYRHQLQSIAKRIRYDALDDVEAKRIAAAFSRVNEATEQRLKETLTSVTWNRLEELTLWLSIREFGLIESLANDFDQVGPFAERALRVTPAQINAWRSHTTTWQNEYARELYKLEDFVTRRLAESLRPQQQRLLQCRLGHDYSAERQTAPSRDDNRANDQSRQPGSVPIHLSIPCATTHALLASLEYPSDFLDRHADPGVHRFPWRDFYLPIYDPNSMFTGDMVAFAKTAKVIELSPAQQLQLQEFAAEKERRLLRLKEEWPRWNDRQSPQRDDFIAAYRELEDEQTTRLHRDVLLPHQSDILKTYLSILLIRRYGLLPLLADGSLGRELEVTQDQRRALFERAPQIRSEVIERLDELYQRLHQDVLATLQPDQRRQVTRALGEIPTYAVRGDFTETLRKLRPPTKLNRATDKQ